MNPNSFFCVFLRFIYYLFIYFIYFWLHQVLAAARGLLAAVHGLLSSCGVRVFSSLVVAHRLQGAWAL